MDRLEAAHAAVSGQDRGRRGETDELNHAILLRLAAEFQGFCRDVDEVEVSVFSDDRTHDSARIYQLKREIAEFRRAVTR